MKCLHCNEPFTPKYKGQIFCNITCKNREPRKKKEPAYQFHPGIIKWLYG